MKNDAMLKGIRYGEQMTAKNIVDFVKAKESICIVPYYWLATIGSVDHAILTTYDIGILLSMPETFEAGSFEGYATIRAKNFNAATVATLSSWAEREVMCSYICKEFGLPNRTDYAHVILQGGFEEVFRDYVMNGHDTGTIRKLPQAGENLSRILAAWILFEENSLGDTRLSDVLAVKHDIVKGNGAAYFTLRDMDLAWPEYMLALIDTLGAEDAYIRKVINLFLDKLFSVVYK